MESVKGLKKFFNQKMLTLLFLLVVVLVVFSILSGGTFLIPISIRGILNSMVITIFLTVGVGLLMVSGSIDLSASMIGTLCGVLFPLFLLAGMAWPIAMIITLLTGGLIGALNATLVNIVGFQPFIATMAVSSVAQGFTYIVTDAKPVALKNKFIGAIGSGRIFDLFPITLVIALIIFFFYAILLSKTKYGRAIYLVGGNRRAAHLSGINPVAISYALFINCGLLAALAGILLTARLKSGTVTGIANAQFSGMTAAMLGGISFGGGSGGFGGVLVGLIIINGFNYGLTVIGVSTYWQTVASGALLLFALIVDYFNNLRVRNKKLADTVR
jgi:ribose/xylose/arabinose/galactoside ABC-type transport system permease subunit